MKRKKSKLKKQPWHWRKRYHILGTASATFIVIIILLVSSPTKNLAQKVSPMYSGHQTGSTKILSELQSSLKLKKQITNTNLVDWFDPSGNHIPLTGQQFVINTSDNLDALAVQSESFFTAHGFIQDPQNAVDSYDLYGNRRLGFSKDAMKCVVQLTENSDPLASFFCGAIDSNQQDLLNQFSTIIDPMLAKTPTYIFRVDTVDGNFAKGTESSITQATWFSEHVNGEWKIILRTQSPQCNQMQQLGIPESIYGTCN